MRSKWLIVILAVSMVVGAGAPVLAAAPAGARQVAPVAGVPSIERLRQQLNLSEEQVRRLEQTFTAHRNRTSQLRLDLARARLDLREAMIAPSPDRGQVDSIIRRIGMLQTDLTRARVNLTLDIRGILTQEQYDRWQLLRGTRRHFRRR